MNHWVEALEEALDAAENEPQNHSAPNLQSSIPILFRNSVPKELLVRARSSDLVRMALEEWFYIIMLAFGIYLLNRGSLLPFTLLLAILLGGRIHALGVILHDATHMPLKKKSLAIRIVEVTCGYPIGTTLNAMRYHHLRHHRDTGMKTDPYHKPGEKNLSWKLLGRLRGVLLVPFWNLRAPFGIAAWAFPSLRNSYGRIFLQDRSDRDLRGSAEILEACQAELGLIVFQLFLVLAFIFFPKDLLWWSLLLMSIAGILSANRVIIEHSHENISDRKITTILRHTQDNYLGILGALGLAPRNIGYHIVHHLHPQVGLRALPALRLWYRRQIPIHYPNPKR